MAVMAVMAVMATATVEEGVEVEVAAMEEEEGKEEVAVTPDSLPSPPPCLRTRAVL